MATTLSWMIAATSFKMDRPLADLLQELLAAGFGSPIKYVWLRRQTKVAQAVSFYRAEHTNVWQAFNGAKPKNIDIDQELEFDFDEIHRIYTDLEVNDWKWKVYFRMNKIQPLMLFYEEFTQNYEVTIRGVLKFLGQLYEDAPVAPPALERQANARSKDWEERYRTMAQERGVGAMESRPGGETAVMESRR